MKNLEVFVNPATGQDAIYIVARSGHKVIDLNRIRLLKASSNYTNIVLEETIPDIIIPKSLCILEMKLDGYNFLRCSSSCLINLKKQGSFNRYLKRIYIDNHILSVSSKRCHLVFPLLTAFGYKEVLRHV